MKLGLWIRTLLSQLFSMKLFESIRASGSESNDSESDTSRAELFVAIFTPRNKRGRLRQQSTGNKNCGEFSNYLPTIHWNKAFLYRFDKDVFITFDTARATWEWISTSGKTFFSSQKHLSYHVIYLYFIGGSKAFF